MQDVEANEVLDEGCEDRPIIDCNAENYINDPRVEYAWAVKAYQHAEIYFNILCAVDTRYLKLTKIDDEIYTVFRHYFADMRVDIIDVDELKSAPSKEIWRPFCESYKERVEDYNMGSLIRIDASKDYSDENSVLVPRIQFFAIEIARNREGYNDRVRDQFKKTNDAIAKS